MTTDTSTTTARRRIQPWTIRVDTREQTPLQLAEAAARIGAPFDVEVGTLACGDYALRDFPDVLCVERKNLDDLVGCVTTGRERFERALSRMALRCRHRLILVESAIDDVLQKRYHGSTSPWAVLSSCTGWLLDFGVPTVWAGDRDTAAELIVRAFAAMRRRIERAADIVEGAA